MIKKISISGFKKFNDKIEIDVSRNLTLFVGPNNSGKTTVMQALSLWAFLLNKWKEGSKNRRTGMTINIKDIVSMPVRKTYSLWYVGTTQRAGNKKIPIIIEVEGDNFKYGFEIKNQTQETFSFSPIDFDQNFDKEVLSAYLPPLSGIEEEEKYFGKDESVYVEIGRGLPGKVLRNILSRIYEESPGQWVELKKCVNDFFDIELLDIENTSSIVVEYKPKGWSSRTAKGLDINTLGSGSLQFILVIAFAFWNKVELIAFDEPDSHQHSFLQRHVFNWLKDLSDRTDTQFLISTHSEVFINESDREDIISFYPKNPKDPFSKTQLKVALDKLSNFDAIQAVEKKWMLAVEDYTDIKILRALSDILDIKINWDNIYEFYTKNSGISLLKNQHNILREVEPNFQTYFVRDGDTNNTQDFPSGITQKRWDKTEIENYIFSEEIMMRFLEKDSNGEADDLLRENELKTRVEKAKEFFEYHKKLGTNFNEKKASDSLKDFFKMVYGYEKLEKSRYFEIVKCIKKEEIPDEVVDVIRKIYDYQSTS